MNTRWIGHPLFCMDEVDSTNEEAKRYANQGVENGALIVAEKQTAGKGRRGRSWSNTAGECLQMSALLRLPLTPTEASGLTLVAALAVCRALEAVRPGIGTSPQIKWPNDIVLGTKKICGILVELILEQSRAQKESCVVIGIGVNVNNTIFPEELRQKAGSLRLEWGQNIDRELLMEKIWQEFEEAYDQFRITKDMQSLKTEYEKRLVNIGRLVRVQYGTEILEGTAVGIDALGHLLVRTDQGETHSVDAGEVSVRGIYGYV